MYIRKTRILNIEFAHNFVAIFLGVFGDGVAAAARVLLIYIFIELERALVGMV